MRVIPALLLALASIATADELKLNQIQAIGSHNSYHLAPPPALMKTIRSVNEGWEKAWNYSHPPLATQLDMGVRQFELDIFADSKGGLFANPLSLKLARLAGAEIPAFNADGILSKPGFKVLHVPDMDCWSNAPALKLALEKMRAWSEKNPRHLPVMILLECKDQPQPPLPTKPESFSRECLLELEREILSAIPAERILKPDEVRRGEKTLRDAVKSHGWPTVDSLRGKFIFALDNTDDIRTRYLEGNPALEGRLIFASAPNDQDPAAGWFKCNDPQREQELIQSLVKQGFLVRTRADTREPDAKMRDAAFASGAQWISTDHFIKDAAGSVRFNGATVRANPMNAKDASEPTP